MDWNTIFFIILPYIAIPLGIVVAVYRSIYRPFTVSSLSSQLLESRQLYWGSNAFHYGISIILLGHLAAILFPGSIVLWNAVPLRLYLLEVSGVILAVWSLAGLLVLIWRRVSNNRIRMVSTPIDFLLLALLFVSLVTGIIIATSYRYGSYWFTGIFTPYIASLFLLQPRLDLVAPLPWIIKLHVINLYFLALVFPFSRLLHIFTYPFAYLYRPWQVVIRWGKGTRKAEN
jgi:nitrate reductase gamma subunit